MHLDLPGPRSTTGHWFQSSIAGTISLPRKNTKEEFKERNQESARVDPEGSRFNACLKT
jgi:hypothetical protein